MPRFLAIDWDHHQLHLIAATVSGGRVTIQHALSWPEPQSPNPATAADLGKQLRDRLKAAGIAPAPVLACVGRDRVIPKDVRHPAVDASEEPTLVRLQVVKELTDAPDEVVIDYTASATGANPNERRSLALVVRKELVDAYQALCAAAGLKLAALTPRMFGIAGSFNRVRATPLLLPPAAPDATVAIVAQGERWVEFTVLQGETLVFARSLAVGPNLAAEVRRNLAVYAGQFSQSPVQALYVAGAAEQLDLQQRLQGMLSVPVALFDPFGPVDRPNLPATGRGGFSGALGLVYLQAAAAATRGGRLPINFVRPRQPVAKADPNRRLYVLVAGLVLLLIAGGAAYWFWTNGHNENQVRELESRKADLDRALRDLDDDDKRFKAVDEWEKGEVNWLEEVYDLTDRFGEGKGVRLVQFSGDPLPRTAKSEYVARIVLKGMATEDPRPVDQVLSETVRDGFYRVEPKTMSPNRGSERQIYPQQFVTKADVKQRPMDKYVRRMPDPPQQERQVIKKGQQPLDFGGDLP